MLGPNAYGLLQRASTLIIFVVRSAFCETGTEHLLVGSYRVVLVMRSVAGVEVSRT